MMNRQLLTWTGKKEMRKEMGSRSVKESGDFVCIDAKESSLIAAIVEEDKHVPPCWLASNGLPLLLHEPI